MLTKTFNEACKIIRKNVLESNKHELIDLENSLERILFSDYRSKIDSPRTDLSSMDGAVMHKKEKKRKLLIANESKAGDPNAKSFKPGECSLIYTGGPIYGKNKKIIPKENFIIKDNFIQILSHPKDDFIRYKASDIHKNKIYLRKRSIITLRALALAKSMKINRVKVLQKPKVLVICTGDEIKSDSIIPSTNNIFIKFFVEYFGGKIINIDFARDNEKEFLKKCNKFNNFDLLITSGGISRGKYDIVKKSLIKIGLKILFERVAIKPGKPTTFGKFSRNKFFLGLPGNPVSCFVSMINFFPVFINSFSGIQNSNFTTKSFISKRIIKKNKELTTFQRVSIKSNYFEVFENQDSSLLNTLNICDGLIIRAPYAKEIRPGEEANILLFNNLKKEQI